MILTQLDPPTILARVNTPRWAFSPLSGAGAARYGGRLNRPGVHALYLSLDHATALAEYQQVSSRLPPGTVCTYVATLPPLVDLRRLNVGDWDPIWEDWSVDWRHQAFDLHVDPSSWDLADLAIAAQSPGIIFPSTVRPGGVNLVIYSGALAAHPGASIAVHDPDGLLPRDDSSWKAPTP